MNHRYSIFGYYHNSWNQELDQLDNGELKIKIAKFRDSQKVKTERDARLSKSKAAFVQYTSALIRILQSIVMKIKDQTLPSCYLPTISNENYRFFFNNDYRKFKNYYVHSFFFENCRTESLNTAILENGIWLDFRMRVHIITILK